MRHLVDAACERLSSYSFDSRMDALLVGCLLAVCLRLGVGRGFLSRVCAPVWAPAVTVFILAISSMADEKQSYRLTFGLALEAVLVAILLCQVITHHKTVYWGWLNSRVIAYLGVLSYPLYLYHGMASAIAERITGSTSAYIITSVIVSILLAALSFHILERPFLALKTGCRGPHHPRQRLRSPSGPHRQPARRTYVQL